MKISATYRFIAAFLSICILAGVSVPAGLHAKAQEECDLMESMHSNHSMSDEVMSGHKDCPMADRHSGIHEMSSDTGAERHDFGFACACNIDKAPVKTEAPLVQKVKLKVSLLLKAVLLNFSLQDTSDDFVTQISDAYSPPPIFLTNESFLI